MRVVIVLIIIIYLLILYINKVWVTCAYMDI